MTFQIIQTPSVTAVMAELAKKDERKLRKVRKTLGLLSRDPRSPGLRSHKREAENGPDGEDIWESYVENNAPSAWRVFWFYGPTSGTITVTAITPHP